MTATDDAIYAFAQRHHNVVTRDDVLSLGGTDHYIGTCVDRRRWSVLHAGVYLTAAGPPTWIQRMDGGVRAAGERSVGSHRAGAALWWLDGSRESLVEVTSEISADPAPRGVILHRTRRWNELDRTVQRGIAVTSVNRTLLDYAAVVPKLLVERAVEDAFRRGLTSEGALRRRIAQIGGPGVRGTVLLRKVLDLRPEGRPARSGFEVITLDVMREGDLPTPHRRLPVVVDGLIVAELDLAYPEKMVAVEPGGAKWHSTATQLRRDEARRAMLRALGWIIIEWTWDEVIFHPEIVVAKIEAALCGFIAA